MNKLTLFTLSTCKKCQILKDALIEQNTKFDEVTCDSSANSLRCDNIEIEIDCNFYPMALITKKIEKDRGGYYVYVDERLIIHFCTKYDDLLIKRKLGNDYYAMCVHSTADMIQLINKHI
jgi:hypothetical protein